MTEQIKALRETRARLIAEAQALIPKGSAGMSTELRTKFNAMIADSDVLKTTIDNLENIEREQRSTLARAANNPRPGQHADNSVKADIRAWMRGETRAAIATGSTPGTYVINQEMYPEIVEAARSWGALSTILKPFHTETGVPVKVPLSNDTANSAADITDGAASTEVEMPLTGFVSQVDDFDSGYVLVTVAELEDASYDVDNFIRNMLMKRIYRKLANALVAGTTNIQSVITTATNSATVSSSATAVSYLDLVALMSNLDPAYLPGSKFVMNQTVRNSLLTQLDTLGRPLFVPSVQGAFDQILGYDVVISQAHPNLGSSVVGAVQFGNFQEGYTLRDVSNIMMFRLVERWLPDYGAYGFLAKARFGGFATNAGTNPVVNLVNHA